MLCTHYGLRNWAANPKHFCYPLCNCDIFCVIEICQGHCRRSTAEDVDYGSWVPVRTCTAVQLPALLEKHRCNLIKELSYINQVAFVNLTTFPDYQPGVSTLTPNSGVSVNCCGKQSQIQQTEFGLLFLDQKSTDFLKWQCPSLRTWGLFWRKKGEIWQYSRSAG